MPSVLQYNAKQIATSEPYAWYREQSSVFFYFLYFSKMKKNLCYITVALIIMLLAFSACNNHTIEQAVTLDGVSVNGDTIFIAEGSNLDGKLSTIQVGSTPCAAEIRTTGEINPIPTQYAEVAAPLAGRVVKCYIRIGQNVLKGSPLFEIASSGYAEIAKEYVQTKSSLEQAERKLNRTKDLFENHVASSKELEEAETEYRLAVEDHKHAAAMSREYQIKTDNIEVGQTMTVRSPVSGKVLKNEVVIGEYLKEDADAKVIVADLSKVWIKANISETDARLVNDIEKVEIRTVTNHDSLITGKIVYVGGMLDPETRTLQTIIECDNRGALLLPNMYADLTLYTSESNHIIVDKTAVLQSGDSRYVLKKVAPHTYCRTNVTVTSVDQQRVIVNTGLNPGDVIVTDGAFYLIDKK